MRPAAALLGLLAVLGAAGGAARAHEGHRTETAVLARLPSLGPAAEFALEDQDGARVTLRGQRGRVVVVAFVYTACREICPTLVTRLAEVQARVAGPLAERVTFLAITLDPAHDTREVLRDYAANIGLDPATWRFLRAPEPEVEAVARAYGVALRRGGPGEIDHTVLTSLVDPRGRLRVQYLGARFSVAEFARDLGALARGR